VSPADPKPPRRVLFVLRGKLGDTVVSFATVRAYADRFPADDVTLLVRANYAPLFRREQGIRVVDFSSKIVMFAKLAMMRWFELPFDGLLVLLGSGAPLLRLGRMVRAARRIFLDARLREVYPEWPEIPPVHFHSEPAWRVAQLYAPELALPQHSVIPSLAAMRRPARVIGIAPASDEPRRTMGPAVVHALISALAKRHPGYAIHVLVNADDEEAQPLLKAGLPSEARLRKFPTLQALVEELSILDHLHTTDTGVYHLAAAMGVPLTTYYGPTQPWKNGFPRQPDLTRIRLAALGGEHCEEKGCRRPVCLEKAVALHVGETIESGIEGTPPGCLLRRHPAGELERVAVLTMTDKPAVPVH
jgi:ADP-heptose:LPS heptosyltransferase